MWFVLIILYNKYELDIGGKGEASVDVEFDHTLCSPPTPKPTPKYNLLPAIPRKLPLQTLVLSLPPVLPK